MQLIIIKNYEKYVEKKNTLQDNHLTISGYGQYYYILKSPKLVKIKATQHVQTHH